MNKSYVNIYNKPLFFGISLSAIEITVMALTLYFYLSKPFERARNSLFAGAAFFTDVMKIFWGYVVAVAILAVALFILYLSYNALRSDKPRLAKGMGIFAQIATAFAVVLGFWFTIQVLFAYGSL